MVLSFRKQFEEPIKDGIKIHTIREDKANRWYKRRFIHGATGVRTKYYNLFFTGFCTSTQNIIIKPDSKRIFISPSNGKDEAFGLTGKQIDELAKNDGFESTAAFWEWFSEPFEGKIIHWTYFEYLEE